MKKKVLILAGYYLPSVKGGGPIRSIKNMVDNLCEEYDFYIIAEDRDLGDIIPFKNIKTEEWTELYGEKVYYINKKNLNYKEWKNIFERGKYDVIYINSFFSYKFSILPLIAYIGMKNKTEKIVIAPRGQFAESALNYKSLKKQLYLKTFLKSKWYKSVTWQATSDKEVEEIKNTLGREVKVVTAENFSQKIMQSNKNEIEKNINHLKLVYIARIHPIKNLLLVLNVLNSCSANIELKIYGPVEDAEYWKLCIEAIENMRSNIKVVYMGELENRYVLKTYSENHMSILLTEGENFGHSIVESMIVGCPVIISDRTPWRNLEEHKAGFDISLEKKKEIIDILNFCAFLKQEEYDVLTNGTIEYAKTMFNKDEVFEGYRKLFD